MPLYPDSLLSGRYRIERFLGRGGMGTVYAARDEKLGRPVAVKVLASSFALDLLLVERFEREVRAAAAVNHPGVVRVYDRGMDESILYAVMELLSGEDLGERLWREPCCTPAFVTRVGVELCAALHAAHSAGVVHRDVKPSNIYLARTEHGDEVVKVLDFGLAKLRRSGASLTRSNQVFGTVAYMAPELVETARNADPRSDVYAVGAILWEMLAGVRAFVGSNPVELTMQVLDRDPPDLDTLRPDLPAGLATAIRCAMHKDPHARVQSAQALETRLRAIRPGPPLGDAPQASPQNPRKALSEAPTEAPSDRPRR